MKKKILVLSGDPNSINSEIIYKSWKNLGMNLKKRICIVSNLSLLESQFKKLNYKVKFKSLSSIYDKTESKKLNIFNIDLNFKNSFNVEKKNASKFVIESLNFAHNLAVKKKITGIVNCAINKDLLKKKKIGVTEYLAKKCKLKKDTEVMLIRNKNLCVSPITTHLNIKDISKKISQNIIINKVRTINNWFSKKIKKKPVIGILGLNPHNAEYRKESEERKIIIPAIKRLRKLGLKVNGPLVSDTVFIKEYKYYDVIVGMYHDQVLSPFKTLFKYNGINITLGLKYIRVSPDHGTAKNLIKKKIASEVSLSECLNFISKF